MILVLFESALAPKTIPPGRYTKMLKSISIKNLAIISSLQVDWSEGLNVLAGETGAGKSILFDALSIALGAKTAPSIIRPGSSKASIEVIFQPTAAVTAWLKQEELIEDELKELIVAREITKSSSRSRINGTLVNLTQLTELRQLLLTFHAQHEIRTLLASSTQLELMDGLASSEHLKLKNQVRTQYAKYRDLSRQIEELSISESERERRLDFARFQLEEIREAELSDSNEDDELKSRQKILESAQDIEGSLHEALSAISGDSGSDSGSYSDRSSARDLLQEALGAIEPLLSIDPSLTEASELLNTSLINLEEAGEALRRYRETNETDPQTLSELADRLNILAGIKRKYGPDLATVIERQNSLEEELEQLENASESMAVLGKELEVLDKELRTTANKLSKERRALAQNLTTSIIKELADLGMERCRFEINFTALDSPGPDGIDKVEFLISPNPGQPMSPLSKIASGGELSRIMLAVKTIFARADEVPCVVFDEIDTGLGGKVLKSLRDKLVKLAASHQILCITHQPMVASVADNFVFVSKNQSDKETEIEARRLSNDEKVTALATMASGREGEEVALSFATSLVNEAKLIKQGKAQLQ